MHDNKLTLANKCTSFAGHFDGLGNPPLQYRAPCLMEDILGYIRCHWTPPPADYSHRIAPAAARVIGFVTHNQGCGGENGTSKANSKKAQNWLSTHIIDIARLELKSSAIFLAIKRWQHTKIGELTKHQRSLSKSWWLWPPIAVKLLMVGVFLYAKSFICNQHLNLYRPTARHQFLIPTITWSNNNNKEQPKKNYNTMISPDRRLPFQRL
jgi:hypothetical protein